VGFVSVPGLIVQCSLCYTCREVVKSVVFSLLIVLPICTQVRFAS